MNLYNQNETFVVLDFLENQKNQKGRSCFSALVVINQQSFH